MESKLSSALLKYRFFLFFISLAVIGMMFVGTQYLHFDTDYRIFFKKDNPQLVAHEFLQETYTSSNNIVFIIGERDGDIFTPETLTVIENITKDAWQTPYSIRVDSLSNYQHTSVKEDELNVKDLIKGAINYKNPKLQQIKEIALTTPELVNAYINHDGSATVINITLELPDNKIESTKAEKEVIEFTREIKTKYQKQYSNLEIHIIGSVAVNNAFVEMTEKDAATLVPAMYFLIIVLLVILLRSVSGMLSSLLLITAAVVMSMGFIGWNTMALNQINIASITVIMTLGVCDSVHVISNFLTSYRTGTSKISALNESLSINILPIFLTSVTTAIGFLSMNFSESPPFQELGNITAVGVMFTMILTYTLLPTLILLLPFKSNNSSKFIPAVVNKIGDFSIKKTRYILPVMLIGSILLSAFAFKNQLNDDTIAYFKEDVPFRQAADFLTEHFPGFDLIEYSIDSGQPGAIYDPEYLAKVESFVDWYKSQPEVVHVSAYTDTIKRLNKNMHQDNEAWYRIPDNRELASQYALLYELSLPFGLDLNNQVSFDKSALKVSVKLRDQKSSDLIAIEIRALEWLSKNYPYLSVQGSSMSLMFAHIGQSNINSMITGSLYAILLVSLTLIFAFRSLKYGLLSLIPNTIPIALAFGLWGIFVGEVNVAVAVIFSITLGIVVDDTVHFMSKYLRAKRSLNYSPEQALNYAFVNVGSALFITTVVLSLGFLVLALSSFNVNAYTGIMTALTIVIALVFDLLMLPALLLKIDRENQVDAEENEMDEAALIKG